MRSAGTYRHGRNPHGFTILELMVGLVSASILALTSGLMLYYAYTVWQRLGASVNLQRDEQIAMNMLVRMTRSGTNMSFVSSPLPQYTIQFSGQPTAAFYASGNSLYYDPNTNIANDQIRLINGTLWGAQFSVNITNTAVTLLLVQKANNDIMSNQVTITRRN